MAEAIGVCGWLPRQIPESSAERPIREPFRSTRQIVIPLSKRTIADPSPPEKR
jgi:hypothetical protein